MRFPVRVFLRCVSSLLIFFLLLQFFASSVFAQTQQVSNPQQQSYTTPHVAENVPRDQHTYFQSMLIEFMLAVQCQITGIDLARQGQSCLGLDLTTGKLGYAPPEAYQNGQLPQSGIMGIVNQSISAMYTPIAGSEEYFRYVAGNFGIVKTAMAAPATGFEGLSPVLELWKTTRDIAYYLLIIAFIFIGIGVMLRIHIDPRTVMTVQNQIPRVIICIILITFSYAMAGLLIDVMWSITYMGINILTSSVGSNPQIGCADAHNSLGQAATNNILKQPLMFFNETFMEPGCMNGGILDLSGNVGSSMAAIQSSLFTQLLGLDCNVGDNGWLSTVTLGLVDIAECGLGLGVNYVLKWFVALIWILIALVIILISLLRIWFSLLKAYAFIFMYVVLGPIWIVFGLLPKKPLGFEKWIRIIFSNLAVFSATAFLMVFARVMTDKFSADTTNIFVPPLVGNPGAGQLGGLIAFAILLATPSILDTLREKLGVPPSKAYQGAIQTFNAGRQASMTPFKKGWQHLNKRDQQGSALGPVARRMDKITGGIAQGAGHVTGLKWLKSMHDIAEAERSGYGGGTRRRQLIENFKKSVKAIPDKAEREQYRKDWGNNLEGWAEKYPDLAGRLREVGYPPYGAPARPAATHPGAPGAGAAVSGAPDTTSHPTAPTDVRVEITLTEPSGRSHKMPITANPGAGITTYRDYVAHLTDDQRGNEFEHEHPDLALTNIPAEVTPEAQAAGGHVNEFLNKNITSVRFPPPTASTPPPSGPPPAGRPTTS